MNHRWAVALTTLVMLFVAAIALGAGIAPPHDALGSPTDSRLKLVEEVFPPRHLTAAEIRRGGPTCLEGNTLVVGSGGGGCSFIVPDGVHVVVFRRVPSSPSMNVTLSRTADLTQSVDTAAPGPDPLDPLKLRFATVHDGTTVTLSGCRGPGPCRLDLAG